MEHLLSRLPRWCGMRWGGSCRLGFVSASFLGLGYEVLVIGSG